MRSTRIPLVTALVALSLTSCKKEEPAEVAPIAAFRTYDLHLKRAIALEDGGYALLCYNPTVSGFPNSAQILTSDGELGARIDYYALPDSVEGFDIVDLDIQDIAALSNNEFALVGISNPLGPGVTRLVVYRVNGSGELTAPPFQRALMNVAFGSSTEARCFRVANGDLGIIVQFTGVDDQTFEERTIFRAYRFPRTGSGLGESAIDLASSSYVSYSPLKVIKRSSPDQNVLLLADEYGFSGLEFRIRELDFEAEQITVVANCLLDPGAGVPYWLAEANGTVAIGGMGDPSPFIATATVLTDGSTISGYHSVSGMYQSAQNWYISGMTLWNGRVVMLTTTIPSFGQPFEGDLSLFVVTPENGAVIRQETVVAGQGLQGAGLFNNGGHLVCIGAMSAYENADVYHTFFMKLKDPE